MINLEQIYNKSTFLSSTDKLLSSLTEGQGTKALYTFPQDIDKKENSTYMVIYIYDRVGLEQFTPIDAEIAKSKILKDIADHLDDIIVIDNYDEWKNELKSRKDALFNALKSRIKKLDLGSFGFDLDLGIDLGFGDTGIGAWLKDNIGEPAEKIAKAIGGAISDLAKDIDFPSVGSLVDSKLIPKLKINKDKLKDILKNKVSELNHNYKVLEDVEEENYQVQLQGAICLNLPDADIRYQISTEISEQDTFTAKNVQDVINSALEGWDKGKTTSEGILGAVSNAFNETISKINTYGKEQIYNFLGSGGQALYQQTYHRIRDPQMFFTYSLPKPRTYTYSYIFAPKNQEELLSIYNIIKLLKYCAAPGYSKSNNINTKLANIEHSYYQLPAKFRVKFYTDSTENTWLGKTKLLGLTNIETTIPRGTSFIVNDYNYASGNAPRLIGLTLTFTELSIIDRIDVNNGY